MRTVASGRTYHKNRGIQRYRGCEKGNFTRDIAVGKSDVLTYLVRGWRQENGVLWQINQRIKVTDPCLNFQGERVVSAMKLSIISSGMTASINDRVGSVFQCVRDER